ncbi:MAG: DinB family protein [Flavobacteriales bacterium]|nr:DinB family protein [Flavobacteriales bacterium]
MNDIKKHNFAEYFTNYTNLVEETDFISALKDSYRTTKEIVSNISDEQANAAYAEGKWTIKELLVHMMDTERIFCERALRFARNEKQDLPGFDHDDFVVGSEANNRSLKSIMKEYKAIRKSTIALFKNFSPAMLEKRGTANKNELTVLSIAFIIVGHEIHHRNVLLEKYLN